MLTTLYNPGLSNPSDQMPFGRVLALDVGKKRIGLAISDELGFTAQGLETLQRTRIRDDLETLKQLAADRAIATLLIGRPLHMSGDESRQSQYTQEFAERLRNYTGIPVVYWDERLTSAEAERLLRDSGASLAEKKNSVDRLAAVLLLESYLGYLQQQKTPSREESLG
jgi:putative holliday junction resolvase